MSWNRRGFRIALLMIGAAGLFYWSSHHAEVTSAVGLRGILQARQILRGDFAEGLIRAIDHPIHPLLIAAIRNGLGRDVHPYAMQTAAQAAAVLSLVLACIPIYLVGRELFDDRTAWLGTAFLMANPVVLSIAVNVQSESTFLLFWAWGVWGALRFLREGRFAWLPPTIAFGALAYLTRPEGLLLYLAVVATLLILPWNHVTRVYWPRWWSALAFLVLGPVLLVGPYIRRQRRNRDPSRDCPADRLRAQAPATALEREAPLTPDQSAVRTYANAAAGTARAFWNFAPLPILPLAVLGLVVWRPGADRARIWLFCAVIIVTSIVGMIRLDATAGYLAERHALIPGLFLILAAAHGVLWLISKVAIDGAKIGLAPGMLRPGPAIWAGVLAVMIGWPTYLARTPFNSSFAYYRQAGSWIADHPETDGHVLDLTDWSLYFSQRPGFAFANMITAAAQPETRFVVVRDDQERGPSYASQLARELVDGRTPVIRYPTSDAKTEHAIAIYNLAEPRSANVAGSTPTTGPTHGTGTRLR